MKNPIALRFFLFSVIIFLFTSKINVTYASSSWAQLGLEDRRVGSLVNDPTNPNILYAGTDDGIYKSTNGGNTWAAQSNQGISAPIVVVASSNHNILYATKGNSGIQKSVDAGTTWTDVTNNLGPSATILDLAINTSDSNTVYVAMYGQCGRVWKTTNGGITWNSVSDGCDFYRVAIAPSNHNIIYAGSLNLTGYFIKSVDGGNTWINPGNQGLGSVGAVRGIAIDPSNPNIIYAGTEINGVFKSIDGATNWTFLQNSPQYEIARTLITDPVRINTIYAGAEGVVFQSNDGGNTWSDISSGLPNARVSSLFIPVNNPNVMYAATPVGVYRLALNNSGTGLIVPYFNQNDLPWGPTEYDNTLQLGLTDPTINRWGCVVTSAAMVLNYHNIKKMPDGTNLDPGSLNVWLKNNNGYAIGHNNMDGWYSYLKFPSVSTLTKRIFDAGKSNIKLEHKRAISAG